MGYRLAVDLGTAFAAAAVVNGSDPAMVGLGQPDDADPVRALPRPTDESFVVGRGRRAARGTPSPAGWSASSSGDSAIRCRCWSAGAPYSPRALMARLLRWVVARATTQQGEAPTELIV